MLTVYSQLLRKSIQSLHRGFINLKSSEKLVSQLKDKYLGVRTLYSLSNLGIDGFVLSSERLRSEYTYKKQFLEKINKFSAEDEKTFFAEDLRLLIAYCQEDKSLVNDVLKLSKLYYDQIKDLNIRPFKFGPIILRLLHYHDCPDEAFKMCLDNDLGNFFEQISSYQILMDLLYENERYEDVIIIMQKILLRELFNKPPLSCLNIALAANYKISTDEALEDSLILLRNFSAEKSRIPLRSLSFAAGLALKLHKPQVAMDILVDAKSISYFLINNLQMLTKAQLGFVDEVLSILRTRVLTDSPKTSANSEKHIYCQEVIDEIEKIVNDTLEMKPIADMKHLKDVLRTMNFISPETLDECICKPFEDMNMEMEKTWSSRNEGFVRRKSLDAHRQY